MTRKLWILAAAVLSLGATIAVPPVAAGPNCQIPAGTYRVNGYTGCASAKWVASGSGGSYVGYIHDETAGWGSLVVEYQSTSGVWRWLGTDVYDGNAWANVTRLNNWEPGPCRPTRMRDGYATLSMNACG